MKQTPWWKGSRGEWYVVAQGFVFLLVGLGPRSLPGWPAWPPSWSAAATILGGLFIVIGGALALAGLLRLGPNLSPLPYPKDDATLVETGVYGLVRHPIYSGLIFAALGWGLLLHGGLTLVYALLLFILFDLKSRREEAWLRAKFPAYAAYQQRVRKLIPFVY